MQFARRGPNSRFAPRKHDNTARIDLLPIYCPPMSSQTSNPNKRSHWESVHVCPKCDYVLNLAEIDLNTITTGIVSCPNCDWSGPIEIRVLDSDLPRESDNRK